MIKKWLKSHNIALYVISFVLSLAVFTIFCIIQGITPFGQSTFATMDANIQYIDFFAYLKDCLQGKQSIVYTFNKSLGGTNIVILSFYLISPFNLLVLFFKKSQLETFFSIALMLKIATSSTTCSVFLKQRFRNLNNFYIVILSLCYSMMTYNIQELSNIEFLDGMYMLPLILLGVYKLIEDGSSVLLIVSVALSMIFSWYTGAENCLFSAIWFFFEYFYKNPRKKFIKPLMQYAICMIIGIAISAFIFVPTIFAMQGGRAGIDWYILKQYDIHNWFSFVNGACLGSVSEKEFPALFMGSIVFIAVIARLISKSVNVKNKVSDVILLLLAWAMCYLPPFVFVFSLLQYVDSYWYRYGYLFMFIFMFIAAEYLNQVVKHKYEIVIGFFLYIVVNIVAVKLSETYNKELFIKVLLIAILVVVALLFTDKYERTKKGIIPQSILLLTIAIELIGNAILVADIGTDISGYVSYVTNETKLISSIDLSGDFCRVSKDTTRPSGILASRLTANYNESLVYNYPSIVSYTSDPDNIERDFMDRVGYKTNGRNITVVNSCNLAVDSLLGVKYELMQFPVKGLTCINENLSNSKKTYLNSYALPPAFIINNTEAIENPSENSFEYINQIYSKILGKDVQIFKPVIFEKTKNLDQATYVLKNYGSDNPVYGLIGYSNDANVRIFADDKLITEYSMWLTPEIFPVFTESQTTVVTVTDGDINVLSDEQFYEIDMNLFLQVINEIKSKSAENVTMQGQNISFTVKSQDDTNVFLSVPYEKGWSATVNGKSVKIGQAFDCFMTLPVKAGKNVIKMHYELEGLKLGILISVFSIIVFVVVCIREYKYKRQNLRNN